MIVEEESDHIEDLIQRRAVHKPIKFIKLCIEDCIINSAGLVIGIRPNSKISLHHHADLVAELPSGLVDSHKCIHPHLTYLILLAIADTASTDTAPS